MARLEVGIGATNKELKSVLSDSQTIVRNFANNLRNVNLNIGNSSTQSINNLNTALRTTATTLRDIARSAASARQNLAGMGGGVNNTSQVQQEALALAQLRTQTQQYRRDIAQLQHQLAQLRLANAQNNQGTNAAAGSYREAQQQLRALGNAIRNAAGGFNSTNPAIQRQIQQYRQLADRLREFDRQMGLNHRNVGNYTSVWGGLGRQLASVAAGYLSLQTAINGVNSAFNSAMKSDAIQASMTFILRNADDVSARLGRVEMSAERLGLGYLGLATTYRSFIGAANASNFSLFEAERIFDAVSNAAGKLKLSNDQVQGAFRALEQMISKGNVQAEELRGQLGERIPGAFAIAARAMGVTEKQLNKMLKDGDVLASELLPRLATELNNTFGLDQSEKVDSLQGSVNRLKNTFDVAIQEGNISKFFQSFVDGANFSLKSINELVNSNGWKEFLENFVMFTNPQFFGGQWSRQVNNSIKTPQDLINSQVSELTNAAPEQRTKIWQREKAIYDSMLADYKAGNKEIQKDLIYQGQLVAAIGKQYFESLKSQTQVTEGAKELTKEQLAALDKARKENEQYQKHLQKLRETAVLETLQGYERELQAARYKWEEELKDARHGVNELLQLRRYYLAETMRIMGKMDFSQSFRKSQTGQSVLNRNVSGQLNRGPQSLPVPQLGKSQVAKVDLSLDTSQLEKGLKRASREFINNMSSSLQWLQETSTKKFGDYMLAIGNSLFSSFDSIIKNTLANKLESTITDVFGSIGKDGKKMDWMNVGTLGIGIGGQILQGATKKTNVLGQTLGGLASGAAAGSAGGWVGAIVGAVVGGISGLLGASAAKRQEKIQEELLAEQKKQTALLERQNALAYTSQIVGQQTNQGLVTGIDRDEFGNIRFRIEGQDLVASLARTGESMWRGI